MRPWNNLNSRGKFLLLACLVNFLLAVFFAVNGSQLSILSILCAMLCGIGTYSDKYKHY
jgi:hypothetical protein